MVWRNVAVYSSAADNAHRRSGHVVIAEESGLHGRCNVRRQILLECLVIIMDAREVPHFL